MEPGDIELLNKYTVDFISFSYYNSRCVRTDENADDMVKETYLHLLKIHIFHTANGDGQLTH